jgi:hypothetical protein
MPRRKQQLRVKVAVILSFVATMSGCLAKPDSVKTFPSPNKEIFYTVETSRGIGPVSSDYTRIYEHFSHGGKTTKQVVLGGEYIENSAIIWTSPTDVDMCVLDGLTDTFRNQVTLITGDDPSSSYTIHNHFREHC